MMKRFFRTGLPVLFAMLCCFTLAADELDNYSKLLDRAENGFWRAAFSSDKASIFRNYSTVLNELDNSSRKIYDLRRRHGSKVNYGDLSRPGILIKSLLDSRQSFKNNYSGFRSKKTTLNEFRRWQRSGDIKQRSRFVSDENLSVEKYAQFLNEVKDENLEMLDSKLKIGNDLRRDHKAAVLEMAQQFYTIITDARVTVLKMRQKDPAFKPIRKDKAAVAKDNKKLK